MACVHAWSDFLKKFLNGRLPDNDLWEKAMNKFIGKNWRKYIEYSEKEAVIFT